MKKFLLKLIFILRGSDYTEQYNLLKSVADKNKLADFQKQFLGRLLLHADKNCPYYHKVFRDIKLIDSNNNLDLSKFNEIPLLNKRIIRENWKNIISKERYDRKCFYNSSGGSTGEPVRLIQDNLYLKWRNATNNYYYKNIVGVDEPNIKKVIIWGSERDIFEGNIGFKTKVSNWLTNTILLNSFKMTEPDMDHYIDVINSYKPDLIRGYAGSLYQICRYARERGRKLYSPKYLISAAETLGFDMRKTIENSFRTKVYDFYGSREVSNLAGECKAGLMHMFQFWNYLEVLNKDNQPVKEGEEGKVVVTNLFNYSMPMIRYEIGDMAVVGPSECSCGNILPTLEKVTGRVTAQFIKNDGTVIHGEYFTRLFYFKDWVKALRVIQEEYKKIRILIVLQSAINIDEKKDIENKIRLVMGQDCQIIWDFVKEIPVTRSGKNMYTISQCW